MTTGALPTDVEFVVVGAGLLGLSAAWHLTRRGREVLVVERFEVGHGRSGSKGECRVFRLGYDDPRYVAMACAALPLWRELEAESGESLLRTTGQVTVGPDIDVLLDAMRQAGAPAEWLTPDEAAKRFPWVGGAAVFEPESGVLHAGRTLAALRREVEVAESTEVVALKEDARGVQVATSAGTVSASGVICCAGAWSGPVLGAAGMNLSLSVSVEQVAYFSQVEPTPIVVERGPVMFYGLPTPDTGLFKAGRHHAGQPIAPDTVDLVPDPAEDEALGEIVARLLPGTDPRPVTSERCLYDNTPDQDFVLDRTGRITIGAGTSGHGFKFGPLLGELLADLAQGRPPRMPIGWLGARRPGLRR